MASWFTFFTSSILGSACKWFVSTFLHKQRLRAIREKIEEGPIGQIKDEAQFDFLLDELESSDLSPEEIYLLLQDREQRKRRRETREDRITGWELAHRRLLQAKECLDPAKFVEWTGRNQELVWNFMQDKLVPEALQTAVSAVVRR